ncbi:MAG: conserved rane protein of unknown function [Blastococcus sp.]|jgi:hypothetical protein|nr:conserved rane protein of unknown function [Blastococcus sp.]
MSTPGSDQNLPQGGTPQGQPDWGPPPAPGYGPAPTYSGAPAGYGAPPAQRPGMVQAAGIIGIVWGALGLLFGLLALTVAFDLNAVLGLFVLVSVVVSAGLLWAGIQIVQGKSPRLLLLVSYVAIAINIVTMIVGLAAGASIFGYLLGFVVPGVVVFLLLNTQSKQYYASRGITY